MVAHSAASVGSVVGVLAVVNRAIRYSDQACGPFRLAFYCLPSPQAR
jgi:hypothetical protein